MATKSKHRKDHKKKVANRNQRLKERKARNDKFQREFIMNLIKQEQEKGLYENSQSIEGPILDGPVLDGPVLGGPILDMNGPILDGPILDMNSDIVTETENVESSTDESVSTEEK